MIQVGQLAPPFAVQNHLVPWIFDYYTKLDFSSAHKIHKIHALRMVSASSALSSFFCYRGLGETVRLSDYEGKNVILWFYPKADTPG